jgi:hypothetical protein
MRERGFAYVPLPDFDYERSWIEARSASTMTIERAETIAYHAVPISYSKELLDAYERLEEATKDDAYRLALGAQEGEANELGCAVLARLELDISVEDEIENYTNVMSEAEEQQESTLAADPALRAGVEQWRSCMSQSGYSYANMNEPFGDPRWAGSPVVTEVEKAVAIADANCRVAGRFDEVLREAQVRSVKSWVDANPDFVAQLHRADESLLRRALAVVESATS